ncbi:MAG: phage virion morphogenesis protein [Chromatiaceae bacterium]
MAGANLTITVEYQDAEVRAALAQMLRTVNPPGPVLRDLGEALLRATDERYRAQQGPDGQQWAPNSDTTLLRYMDRGGKGFTKKGRVSAQGARRLGAKVILRDAGALQDTLRYQVTGDGLELGTNRVYGAAQQFGMPKGDAGRTRRGAPIPWGDIPARPYLGIADDDKETILDILRAALRPVAGRWTALRLSTLRTADPPDTR